MLKMELSNGKKFAFRFMHNPEDRVTGCEVLDDKGFLAQGYAFCHPKDRYNKVIGRKLALRDALQYCFTYEERQEIWHKLLSTSPKTYIPK